MYRILNQIIKSVNESATQRYYSMTKYLGLNAFELSCYCKYLNPKMFPLWDIKQKLIDFLTCWFHLRNWCVFMLSALHKTNTWKKYSFYTYAILKSIDQSHHCYEMALSVIVFYGQAYSLEKWATLWVHQRVLKWDSCITTLVILGGTPESFCDVKLTIEKGSACL